MILKRYCEGVTVITANVAEVRYRINEPTGEAILYVTYSSINNGLPSESFVVESPVYLMNDNGKTVETFRPCEPSSTNCAPV